jgi:3-hydroxyacyl-CoA dehydrogenase
VLESFGFPMGPFRMRDLAGMDIGWAREQSRSSTVREILCEMGRLGQKSGGGYYDYDASRRATPSLIADDVVRAFAAKQGIAQRVVSDEEILERCLYPMVMEGLRILEEGIAERSSDIDMVWITGYGWPSHTGGPMYWGQSVGIDKIRARWEQYATKGNDN